MGALSPGRCLVWVCVLEIHEKAAEELKFELLPVHQQGWLLLQQYLCASLGCGISYKDHISWTHWLLALGGFCLPDNLSDAPQAAKAGLNQLQLLLVLRSHKDSSPCPVSTGQCFGLVGSRSWINRHSLEFGLHLCFQDGKGKPSCLGEKGRWEGLGLKQALLS